MKDSNQFDEAKRKRLPLWRPVLLVITVIVLLVLARVFGLGERLGDLRDWIQGLGVWGPLAFIGIYVAATIAAIPGLALTIAAGVIFGSVMGTILVSISSTLGASLAFLRRRKSVSGAHGRCEWPGVFYRVGQDIGSGV